MKKNKLVTIFLIIIVGSILIFSILYWRVGLKIDLNENQIFYVFSASPQVIAGLFGLSIAGYVFFTDKLDRAKYDDETLIDVIDTLKLKYYHSMIFMSIVAILSIFLSITVIFFYDIDWVLFDWLTNVTIMIILGEVALIICFACSIIDPNKIRKISNILIKDFEKGDLSKDISDYSLFMRDFNEIEVNLKRQYEDITFSIFDKNNKTSQIKLPSRKIVRFLYHDEKIGHKLFEELLSIIKYRNYLIHSNDIHVHKLMCEKARIVNEKLKEKLNVKN